MRKVKKSILISAVIFILVVTTTIVFIAKIPTPPSIELAKARVELNKAETAKSKQYAKYQYKQAKDFYDFAYLEWKSQNYRFILKRNYSKVRYYANISYIHSKESKSLAIANSRDITKYLNKKITDMGSFYKEYDSLLRNLPLNDNIIRTYHNSIMAFSEAKVAFKSDDLNMAMKKIAISEEKLEKTKFSVSSELKEYFKKYRHWRQASENAIRSSKQKKNTVIVVDKFAKKCFVYNKGNLKHIFNVELGRNWIGTKKVRNDKATPEGVYKVQKKLDRSQTKYYKALLIDYPNEEDELRFKQAKKKGEIPKDANIGGSIEIHGDGGKGVNWTNGCVALSNEDMDRLYDLVRNGTQVVIVGSLSKLSDIIDF
jgi:L,D-peptidoglycan transpeptidase YkuD (ErfK/YbiS/YcfS/YnhG family)